MATASELAKYPHTKVMDLRKMRTQYKSESSVVKLLNGLEGDTTALLHVKVPHEWGTGRLPISGGRDSWMPIALPLKYDGRREDEVQGLDRCFCRFVTQPRFNMSQDDEAAAVLPIGVHLRTGYADVEDVDLRVPAVAIQPSIHQQNNQ